MTEPHIDEKELQSKIYDLFEYRLFPQLLTDTGLNAEESQKYLNSLAGLQATIYHLDAHLEANWTTKPEKLAYHWNQITGMLEAMGVPKERSHEYLNHIRKYEKHELELRQGRTPLRFDMEYFYFYKSCDVKLLRRLIYERFMLAPQMGTLADWRYYDLITEVNDDVEDLFEDLGFINGNRFLISLILKGKPATAKVFGDFLELCSTKALEREKTSGVFYREVILPITIKRMEETRQLMNERLREITAKQLTESRLFKHQTISS